MDLVLPLKAEYFNAIKDGTKTEEFRLRTPFWRKRLEGKTFDRVVLTLWYPGRDDAERRIVRPWGGMRETTITHPHFGAEPVDVYAIKVSRRPSEEAARRAIEAWLDKHEPGYPTYSLCEDGDDSSAENKCGWAFWICPHDTTSYLHEDLTVEWYGTGWPEIYTEDPATGDWHEVPPNQS